MHRLRPLIGIAALLLVWQGALSLKPGQSDPVPAAACGS